MGMTCPPRPLTKAEFDARVKAGARTMAEIDPEFHRWLEQGRTTRMVVVVVGAVVMVIAVLFLGQ